MSAVIFPFDIVTFACNDDAVKQLFCTSQLVTVTSTNGIEHTCLICVKINILYTI